MRYTWIVPIALAAIVLMGIGQVSATEIELSHRIVEGTPVSHDRYRFMVSVYRDEDADGVAQPVCGGSHIGDGWILTAAHCVVDGNTGLVIDPENMYAILDERDLSSANALLTRIQRIIVHPEYVIGTDQGAIPLPVADLALLQLAQSFNGPVLTLPQSASLLPVREETAFVTGWGRVSEEGEKSADLLEASLPIVSNVRCFAFYRGSFDANAHICAGGGATGADTCLGDSGGPIIVQRGGVLIQAGIVSYGIGCARPGHPGIYTRLTHFVNWIADNTTGSRQFQNPLVADTIGPGLRVLAQSDSDNNEVGIGQVVIYELVGIDQVSLTTQTGDADLFIFSGTTLERSQPLCISEEVVADSLIDSCTIKSTGNSVYAVVYGFQESTYSISTVASAVASSSQQALMTPGVGGDAPPASTSGGGGGGAPGYQLLLILLALRTCRWTNAKAVRC